MPKILNRISFTTIAVLTAFITLAVYSDDIVGIRRYDAGTNEFIGVEMPFDSISAGPSAFISGDFLGDGSIFSDRLYLCSQDGAGTIDKTSDLNELDEVQLNYAFLSDGIWLDSSTLSRSTMTPTAGDTLYLLRADAEPFSFFLHGRYPFSPYYTFPIPSFSQISVSRGVASIRFDTDRPVDIFQSNNNKINCLNWSYIGRFPYSQEIQFETETSTNATSYFLVSDATLDTDADAISDALEKYVYGTSANLADTDFDGIPDALEIAWNRNPLLADEISQTLFCETFEPPQVTIGSLDGQNSWNATHNVLVQDAISDSGGSSLLICAHSNETGVASHAINASTNKTVWIDCRVSHEDFANAELPSVSPFVLAFVFDAFGHPVMTDGFTIVTNTAFVCDTKEYFHRVTMHLDFNLRRWNLYIDGILAGENLSMRGENPALNEIFFEGDYGFADNIKVTTARPEGLSSDFDKMSDEWEMSSFGSLSRDGKGDFDSDGLLDEEEYIYGTDPKHKDTDLDSIPDSWEVLQSLNPLDSSDAAADFDNDGLTNLQEYHYDSNPFMSENSLFLLKEGFRDGINVSYYRSDSALTTLPDVSKLDFMESKIVTNVNENTATNALGNAPSYLTDNFVAIYSGYIYIPTAGMVTFTLASDDGSRLTIDSQTLIDNDGTHTKLSKKATKSFMPGLYPFSLEYFNASSTAELMLSWKLPNGEETQIPAENYYILKYPGSENVDLDRDGMQDWWEKIQGFDSSSAADAILDSDADGLTNLEEFSIRSNPYAVDSDGDTLTDKEEVFLGSSPIKIDTDNDGLPDALELRYGWDPNWPGETDPANAPNGPFTTFTHYADGTKASVDAKLRNAINKEAIAKFTVKVDISSPDPYDMTVYGLGSPGGIATLDDMITRDSCRNYTTVNTNNFIYVKTLNPKPAFCPDQTGILMIKLKCDDHAKVTIGNITVENAWPNEEYALAWGIVEANSVNPVDITWDSNKGGCWNLDYECYFYPEDIEYDVNIESGTDVSLSTYNELSEELGYPVPVWTNDFSNAGVLTLSVDTHLHCGTVRIAFSNANDAEKFQLWTKNTNPTYDFDEELILGGEIGPEHIFTKTQWDRLVEKFSCDDTLEVYVLSSGEGVVNLELSYDIGRPETYEPAFKEQRITSVGPLLLPDYNRDGSIDDSDAQTYIAGRMFRYWVNECKVSGAVWEEPSLFQNIADAIVGMENWRNNHVDGTYDLINLFPVAVNFNPFILAWDAEVSFRITSESGTDVFNYTIAEISHLQAGTIRTAPHVDINNNAISNATLSVLDSGGIDISWMQALSYNENCCLLVAEARASRIGGMKMTVAVNGMDMYSCRLPIRTSPVDDMFRFVSIRGAYENTMTNFSGTDEPPNNPDVELATKDVFFVHGFNVDLDGAKNWNREMFKRFWVSGMNARYWGVTWDGDYHIIWPDIIGENFNGLHYHRDVRQALMSAQSFANLVNQHGHNAVVLGHSLGNMVVSEGLLKGANASTYIMLDAAVASEAYRPQLQANSDEIVAKYRPDDWAGYDSRTWAANWYTWFTNNASDIRSELGWAGHFAPLLENPNLEVYNFYSSGDEVFAEASQVPGLATGVFHWPTFSLSWPFVGIDFTLDAFPWQKQEVFKGVNAAGSLSAGWGFHCWTTNINNKTVKVRYSAVGANAMVTDGSIITNAVFDRGVAAMFRSDISDYEKADILAFHIPAVSSPAGKVRTLPDASRCYDLNSDLRLDRWGRSHDGGSEEKAPWLHSDIKNMSYFYIYPAFNEILEKGNLK